ncbi:MAG TPA: GTP 3',8-cyclase MoaA [Hyphomonas sp.]|nr:GTP 3',8-cyclase MoaA [Hyphomonas sp.]MCC0017749.1 GTP 3',8-cyclase MoaA [Rhodobiaceae bacterium]HPE46781.1 GTP 3',8-cyclase MoaA [Hyphomonas sp.]
MKFSLIDNQPERAPGQQDSAVAPLIDGIGREVTYLRLSVTDRCDLRCSYCMPERMQFLPKKDVLSFEELAVLVDAFIARGIRKLRITGGEPLVRRDVLQLLERLAERRHTSSLQELCLTTNGTRLAQHAADLKRFGVDRINVSLDTLNRETFAELTRRDVFDDVMAGIRAAKAAGLTIKINTVALKGINEAELPDLISWAHGEGFDLSLIEVMPLGEGMTERSKDFLSLQSVREQLAQRWTLDPVPYSSGGPSRYVRIAETGGRLGFISPLSHNFCDTCNRVRVTCTGMLYTCLGHDGGIDLRDAVRSDDGLVRFHALLDEALGQKPARHDFDVARIDTPSTVRTMSHTGG